ncbi:SulP family inorganic anion transporter [Roseateles sp. BYS180W]|uniref:SulP family inorganic anion transporter n=1 Tax=Roseateles rivi TaxID=3299028 RepID=A0ABW7FWQ7_9BURK
MSNPLTSRLDLRSLSSEMPAALMVAVLLIPQSLAYAALAGLPPEVGLYASVLPMLAYALLGSSPHLAVGPVAVLALLVAQALGQLPQGVSPTAGALVLAAQVGLLLGLAALLRLDALSSLLSLPVLTGFEAGATLAIAVSQIPVLLGSSVQGSNLPMLLMHAAQAGWPWHAASALLGGVALMLLALVRHHMQGPRRHWGRVFPLLLLLSSMALAWALGSHHVMAPRVLGELPQLGLPLGLPLWDSALWWRMAPTALVVALMAYVSSLVVAESLGRRAGTRVDARREMLGLAGANMAAALSGGMPVAGSFSRSALAYEAGARTRAMGVMVAVLMALAAWALAPALAWLPRSVLGAIIFFTVLSGFSIKPFVQTWRHARAEAVLMVVVALLALLVSVSLALGVGVLGSIALLLQRTAVPHVALIGRIDSTEHYRNAERFRVQLHPTAMGLRVDESLLFTNARRLVDVALRHLAKRLHYYPATRRVVLNMSPVNHIDASGLQALRDLQEELARFELQLDLAEVKGPVLDSLKAAGLKEWFRGRVFVSTHQAMLADDPPEDWVTP